MLSHTTALRSRKYLSRYIDLKYFKWSRSTWSSCCKNFGVKQIPKNPTGFTNGKGDPELFRELVDNEIYPMAKSRFQSGIKQEILVGKPCLLLEPSKF